MSWRNNLRKLRARSWRERSRLLEALLLLGAARAAVLLFSFSRVAGWVGLVAKDTKVNIARAQANTAAEIGWAVRTASARTPWQSACLVQTLAAAAMLRRRKVPCTLFLGVARDAQHLTAHAWLGCGADILTGSGGRQRFTQISAFSLAYAEHGPTNADMG